MFFAGIRLQCAGLEYQLGLNFGLRQFRALVMGDGVPCYGALEIVGLLLLLLLLRPNLI